MTTFTSAQCALDVRTAMSGDASGLRAFVRDFDPNAIGAARDKGAALGTLWSPPV